MTKKFQCKYCPYTTPWLKDISQHEMQSHKNYSAFAREDVMHNNNDDNGLSALLIDNVDSYGEVLSNGNNDMIMIEEDIDDDEDDAYDFFLLKNIIFNFFFKSLEISTRDK